MQVPKKLTMRSSHQMSSSVQVLDQLLTAMVQAVSRHCCASSNCLAGHPYNSLGKQPAEPLSHIYWFSLSGLGYVHPGAAFLVSISCALLFLPVFSFSEVPFSFHILKTCIMPALRFTHLSASSLLKIWASKVCWICYLLQHDTQIFLNYGRLIIFRKTQSWMLY